MAIYTGRFGLSVALATPFDDDGSVNLGLLTSHATWCLENGCDSITLFGTTGEGPSLSRRERQAIYAGVRAAGIAGDRLIVAVIQNAIGDAVEQIDEAYRVGAAGVLLAPPSYFGDVSDDGVAEWYQAVLRQLGSNARNIFLYHIPALTGVALSVGLISRLRAAFGSAIVGVKDSGCDWEATQPLIRAHRDISILVGDERDLAAAIRIGGAGSIGGVANIFPQAMAQLVRGHDDPFIQGIVDVIDRHGVIPTIKAMIADNKGEAGWLAVRPPLCRLDEAILRSVWGQVRDLERIRAA